MAVDIKVPSLGESVSEAIIAQWFKAPGEAVAKDEPIVELETDKINVEINAPEAGVMEAQLIEEGESVAVGDVIARIDTDASPTAESAPAGDDTPKAAAEEASADEPAEERSPNADVMPPSVTRLVAEHKLDASKITGTGKGGRLTKGDVLEYIESGAGKAAKSAPATAPETETVQRRQERVKMTPLRRTIARRLVQSQAEAAMLTTFNEVDMSAVMAIRSKYKEAFIKRHDIKLGFMSFFVKAAVDALKAYPGVNAEVDGDSVIYKYHYDIGVAVGGGKGLVVPVIKNADRLGFGDVEKTIGVLAGKAQKNKLTMDDLTGGTFTISNGGIYGSMMSTPILNPPQTGILGMHNIIQRPIAINGEVVVRPMMYLALSYDHRVVDGREAVSFLVRIKQCIEDPERMLLEV